MHQTHDGHGQSKVIRDKSLNDIAYSMDVLIPGFYFWCGPIKFRVGGSEAEDSYPGTIHAPMGIGVVLPGYRIWTTYKGSYDPREA